MQGLGSIGQEQQVSGPTQVDKHHTEAGGFRHSAVCSDGSSCLLTLRSNSADPKSSTAPMVQLKKPSSTLRFLWPPAAEDPCRLRSKEAQRIKQKDVSVGSLQVTSLLLWSLGHGGALSGRNSRGEEKQDVAAGALSDACAE